MPEKTLERHAAVTERDLPKIYAYIAKHNPTAADRVLDAVEETFRQIAQQSECGAIFRSRNPKLHGVRFLPVTGFHNYLVFYRTEGEKVRVLYVIHGARHLLQLFRRELRD